MARQGIDRLTMAGWGMLLMPLLTMWHEIGGHAAACAVLGGRVAEIGAFNVRCADLSCWPDALVACAGVLVNIALSLGALACWRRARTDRVRLALWLIRVSEAFVAAGYLCFSGVTGAGDLGVGRDGSLSWLPMPALWRVGEIAAGVAAYILVVCAGIRGLSDMVVTGPVTRAARRGIAHPVYLAAALSFGGLAGFISIGFAARGADARKSFVMPRNRMVIVAGAGVLLLFAAVLGPSFHPRPNG